MSYLVLHIDLEFIVGTVCANDGTSYPITNGKEDLLWLYFHNNPHQNRISFGKENRTHYNNNEINYYGRFFKLIENEQETFTIRGIQKKTIELLEYSDLLKTLKEKYESVTHENPVQIPILLTFSLSVSELAKQKTVEYLKTQGFQIKSYTIPLAELACYHPFSKKNFMPANGSVVLLLAATNTNLHLMKLVFSTNYFILDSEVKTYEGKGMDPRKRALVKFVVNEINNATGALTTDREKEDECEKMESKAEEWLKQIGAQSSNRPFRIVESFSKMPNAKKEVFVRNNNIESDTGHYIQELMDIFDAYKSDNVRGDIAAIFLLGDCFQNSLVLDRFNKLIHREKLFVYANKDIHQILAVYPKIDINRYKDDENRINDIAIAKKKKKNEAIGFFNQAIELEKNGKLQEALAKVEEALKLDVTKEFQIFKDTLKDRIEEIARVEKQRKEEAQELFNQAIELEKKGQLQDARANAKRAIELYPENTALKKFLVTLENQIKEQDRKIEQYKALLNNADKLLKDNNLVGALTEYKLAKNVINSDEIINKILEIEKKIEFKQIRGKADKFFQERNLDEAEKSYREALKITPNDTYCLEQLSNIQTTIQQRKADEKDGLALIAAADDLFNEEKWQEAKEKYEEASKLIPKENGLSDKIQLCSDKLRECEDKIKDLLFEATVAEKKGKLKEALSLLEKAQEIKSDDSDLKKRIKIINFNLNFGTGAKPAPQKPKVEKKDDFLNKPTKKSCEDDDFLGVSKNKKANTETKNSDGDFLGIGNKKTSEKKSDDDFFDVPKKKNRFLDF
jgi:tetratricopeptide (TPR) repeat protein